MKIDWKRKLTSRKFWMAVASFVSMLIVAFGGSEAVASQVTALIIAGATVIAYIIGEGLTDAAGSKTVSQAETVADKMDAGSAVNTIGYVTAAPVDDEDGCGMTE